MSDGDQWVLRGGSAIIGPDGAYLAEPVSDTATTIMADLDLARLTEERLTLDVTGHYARPDIFAFRVASRERPRPDPDRS